MTKLGLPTFALALAVAGTSYASPVALVCSGNMMDVYGYKDAAPASVMVDLDHGVVVWGDDTIPIVNDNSKSIKFKSKGDSYPKEEGTLDRVTGEFWGVVTPDPKTDPRASAQKDPNYYFLLTCKSAKPLF